MSAALVEHAGCWVPGGRVVVVVLHLQQGERSRYNTVSKRPVPWGDPPRHRSPHGARLGETGQREFS